MLRIKADNDPESGGRRTQFLGRIVEFAGHLGKSVQLLFCLPDHSTYNPAARCWGIVSLGALPSSLAIPKPQNTLVVNLVRHTPAL